MKMTIDNEIKERLLHIDWMKCCGNQNLLELVNEYAYVKNVKNIEKSLEKYKWENVCLDASGELTVYLSLHYSEQYNKYWNIMVDEAKAEIITSISKTIANRCKKLEIPEKMNDYINWDIVTIALAFSYKKYYESTFYDDMLKIYESGHLPCGWIGRYPKGKFKIF